MNERGVGELGLETPILSQDRSNLHSVCLIQLQNSVQTEGRRLQQFLGRARIVSQKPGSFCQHRPAGIQGRREVLQRPRAGFVELIPLRPRSYLRLCRRTGFGRSVSNARIVGGSIVGVSYSKPEPASGSPPTCSSFRLACWLLFPISLADSIQVWQYRQQCRDDTYAAFARRASVGHPARTLSLRCVLHQHPHYSP